MMKKSPPTPSSLRILSSKDVDTILSSLDPELALDSQKQVCRSFSSKSPAGEEGNSPKEIQTPHRITISSKDQTILFMPSRAAEAGGVGCKIVSVPTGGGGEGLPGSTVLVDDVTGRVRAIVNARKLTALRNACGSALSLRALNPSRPPTNFLIFGTGAQAHAHATLFLKLWPSITTITFIIRRPTPRSASLITSLTHEFPNINFSIGLASPPNSPASNEPDTPENLKINLSQAVHNADIILTATSSTLPLFNSVDVRSGTHIILVGSYKPEMQEVDSELIRRAGVVVVDSKEACLKESGELIRAGINMGGLVDLGELLDGGLNGAPARTRVKGTGDVNVFKSVGVGIQDVAIANLVLQEAERLGLGTVVEDYD